MRPSIIVGDSRTGEIDKLDGPYYLMVLIATNASGLSLPILGRGDSPTNLVGHDALEQGRPVGPQRRARRVGDGEERRSRPERS